MLRNSLVLLTLSLATACATSHTVPEPPDPVATLELYRDALIEKRPREAFAMIHPDAREGLDEAQFEALYAVEAPLLIAEAEALVAKAQTSAPRMRALVHTGAGELLLELTPSGWRVLHPLGTPPPR
jgi:hypothetical protein